MLRGFNYPLTPKGKSTLNPPPPWYYSADFLNIEFWADPSAVTATLPTGLDLDPEAEGHANALFYDWQFSGSNEEYLDPARYQYREFFILLDALFEGRPVSYCPYIFVDNDAALARGWTQGYPKRIGSIFQTRYYAAIGKAGPALAAGSKFAGSLSVVGQRLAEGLVTLREPVKDYSGLHQRPVVNLLHFPCLAAGRHDKPAIHELVENVPHDVKVEQAWIGDEKIRWIGVRHEEAAAFAAGAEAHLTGKLAVCAGSCGPGNLHLINGLYDCQRSRVPVLAIAAQVPSAEIGSGYFQETHPEQIFAQCSHYCELISQPEQMPRVLEIAMQTAISRRGVAVVVIPGDVALRDAVEQQPRLLFAEPKPTVCPSDDELHVLAEVLNRSKKITILGGAGCAGAHGELVELAGKLQAPIVHAFRGKEFIEYDNPFDVGMTGLLGFSSGYYAMMNCDTLLMIGTDFPYRQFFPKEATVVQIDVRGEQLGRRCKVDFGFVGDTKTTLRALLPRLEQSQGEAHLKESIEHYRKTRQGLDELARGDSGRTPIHPQYVASAINQLASEDAIFTFDVGTPVVWAARYLRMNGKRRLVGSLNHGSMANALPQAIGAQVSHPGRQVISMSGDGGLAMLMGELLTLRQHDLPVKLVVFKNDSLAFVELEMRAGGFLDFATHLRNPDFAKVAEAVGLLGLRAETPEQVEPAIAQALKHDGPALVEVLVSHQELSMPPTITYEEAKSFGLFMLKAVLNGRGNEIVDLARVNLLR